MVEDEKLDVIACWVIAFVVLGVIIFACYGLAQRFNFYYNDLLAVIGCGVIATNIYKQARKQK